MVCIFLSCFIERSLFKMIAVWNSISQVIDSTKKQTKYKNSPQSGISYLRMKPTHVDNVFLWKPENNVLFQTLLTQLLRCIVILNTTVNWTITFLGLLYKGLAWLALPCLNFHSNDSGESGKWLRHTVVIFFALQIV